MRAAEQRAERARRDPATDRRAREALGPVRDLEPEAAQGGVQLGAGDAGPDDHPTADGIDVEHPRELSQVEHGERRAVAAVVGVDPAREARSAPSRDECHVVLGAGRDEPGDALGIVRAQHQVRRRDGVAAPAAHDIGIRGPRGEREPHGGIVDDVGIPREGGQHGRLDVRGRWRGVRRLGGGGRRRRLAKSPAQLPQRHLGGGHRGWRRLTEAPPEGARQRLFGPGIGHPTEG